MTAHDRRWFLKQTANGFAAAAMGSLPGVSSFAQNQNPPLQCTEWGSLPDPAPNGIPVGSIAQWNCANHPGYKVLDIWLLAGASPWETFWIPGIGANQDPDMQAMQLDQLNIDQVNWAQQTSATDTCTTSDIPTSNELFAFGTSADEKTIYWGPAAKPLWTRPDIIERTRMMTLSHELAPHQAATPYGLSGLRLGNPRRSGTGAFIQRRHAALSPESSIPAAYILHRNRNGEASDAAVSGTHPGISRPVVVSVGSNSFAAQLNRSAINPVTDNLFDALRGGYTDRLRWQGQPVRSSGFGSYRVSSSMLMGAAALQQVFSGGLISISAPNSICVGAPGASPMQFQPGSETELNAAAHLLSQDLARYVCVIDSGLGGPFSYDTHGGAMHVQHSMGNLLYLCRQIARNIYHPEFNPNGSINLDDTLIVINSEFGRTPLLSSNGGRDHWPFGYLSMSIGGPITAANGGIRGGFDSEGLPLPGHAYSPTDVRGAMLLAAGIDPFGPDGLRLEEFSASLTASSLTHAVARDRLVECCFGL